MPRARIVPRMRSGAIRAVKEAADSLGAEQIAIERLAEAKSRIKAEPDDPQALEDLARCHLRCAYLRDDMTEDRIGPKAQADLTQAARAWQRYLAHDPSDPDASLAFRMANAYGKYALNDPGSECQTLEIALEHTDTPTAGRYERLARLYHAAGRTRESAVAADRAVELMPRLLRGWMRRQMRDLDAPTDPDRESRS